jgi:hypothetical protein
MNAPKHHTFGVPHSAGHLCTPRRRRTPGADRKARSRPLVKGGGGVVPTRLGDLEGTAYWLREIEGLHCEPNRESIARALAEYVEFRVSYELADLGHGG